MDYDLLPCHSRPLTKKPFDIGQAVADIEPLCLQSFDPGLVVLASIHDNPGRFQDCGGQCLMLVGHVLH